MKPRECLLELVTNRFWRALLIEDFNEYLLDVGDERRRTALAILDAPEFVLVRAGDRSRILRQRAGI